MYYLLEKLLIAIHSSSISFTFTECMINDGTGMINVNYCINIYYINVSLRLHVRNIIIINNVTGMIDVNNF